MPWDNTTDSYAICHAVTADFYVTVLIYCFYDVRTVKTVVKKVEPEIEDKKKKKGKAKAKQKGGKKK